MTATGTVLDRILARKAEEVADGQRHEPLADLQAKAADQSPARGFRQALADTMAAGRSAVIAEVKKASPSKGVIRPDFDPPAHAKSYADGGAACLSVLTDRDFFQGADSYLVAAREAVAIPVLRKDFTIDPWQIWQARALGADCILLIAAALSANQLAELSGTAAEAGLDVLLEVHNAAEMAVARQLDATLVGVNNRNLHTFETDLQASIDLRDQAPDGALLVTESGIHTAADVARMRAAGINCFLVGEAFMRAPDPGTALRELFA